MLGLSVVEISYLLSAWVAISVCSMTQSEWVTYRLVLTVDHFHHSLMRIDGYGMSGSYYGMCVQSQLGLGSESLVTT